MLCKFNFHLDAETYFCSLRLKSLPEEDTVKMLAGSAETHLLYVGLVCSNFRYCIFSLFLTLMVYITNNITQLTGGAGG